MGLLKDILSFFSFKFSSSTQPARMVLTFPRYPTEIKSWRMLLVETITDKDVPLSVMEETRVERLELWKRKSSPYHEFLLAYTVANPKFPGLEAPVCIHIDRTVLPRAPVDPESTSLVTSTSESMVEASKDYFLSQSVKGNPANDCYQRIDAPMGNMVLAYESRLLITSMFHLAAQPTIIDLVATAEALTYSKESYHLLKSQCYWYAGALLAYMERGVSVAPTILIKDPAQLNQSKKELMEEMKLKPGHFRSISIFNPETADVSALRGPITERVADIRGLLREAEESRVARDNDKLLQMREVVREEQEAAEAKAREVVREAREIAEAKAREEVREARELAEAKAREEVREARELAEAKAREEVREARELAEAKAREEVREARELAEAKAQEVREAQEEVREARKEREEAEARARRFERQVEELQAEMNRRTSAMAPPHPTSTL
ncbi:hypothetical protein BD779DRAFT_235757 [Infundibulicybe gibba]|nr:hypothetical protein BD779DRAFT_235757 [Infundibulicybe gibba]